MASKRIVVGTGGSGPSLRAVDWAARESVLADAARNALMLVVGSGGVSRAGGPFPRGHRDARPRPARGRPHRLRRPRLCAEIRPELIALDHWGFPAHRRR